MAGHKGFGRSTGTARGGFARRIGQRVGVPILLVALLFSGLLAQLAQAGIGLMPTASAHALNVGSQGKPDHFDFNTNVTSGGKRYVPTAPAQGTTGPTVPTTPSPIMPRSFSPSMSPANIPLSATQHTHFTTSDSKLDIDIPVGAVTAADVSSAGGTLTLEVTEIAPPSGSNAGGSGHVSFGTYLFQVVDGQGALVTHGLRKPITLILHYGSRDSAVDIAHTFVVLNGPLPANAPSAPTASFLAQARSQHQRGQIATVPDRMPAHSFTMQQIGLGPQSSTSATLDPTAHTLTVSPALSSPSGTASWNTDSPVASFGSPDPFNASLSAGSLSASFPLDLPPGPGGLTPPVLLSYSSASVSENHSPQAAAGWVGEGWDLSLGSISWAEHDATANCSSTCGDTWEDNWQLSDPFGTSAELIPPNINVATYYDDSPNSITASPVQWHTAPESFTRIYSYVAPYSLPYPSGYSRANPPCFRVFLPNGIMEEFGCTLNSIQYYPEPSGPNAGLYYISKWNLDLIADAHGNQIQITYNNDMETGAQNLSYPRDSVLSTVQWDAPSCLNHNTACASWSPLLQVSFSSSHTPARLTGTAPTGCPSGSNLRCDDPANLGSGTVTPPIAQSTFVLNDAYVQAYSGGSWHNLKDYQFSYSQTGSQQSSSETITDPMTNEKESTAGSLLLTRLTVVGDDSTTALPTDAFDYTQIPEYYEDSTMSPNPVTNCGPTWNTGKSGTCLLWSTTYGGNSWYLSSFSNGLGAQTTFTWENARNNTHGLPSGGTAGDTNYCNANQTGYPCDEADDQNWSHAALTERDDSIQQFTSGSPQTLTSKTSYKYWLATGFVGQECSDCTEGMYWGNENDGDYFDYYNGKFMGFAEADVTAPDNSVTKNLYYSTEGYGVYDTSQVTHCYSNQGGTCHSVPWWHLTNAAHGHLKEVDSYDVGGSPLLSRETIGYSLSCPSSGVAGTPSDPTWGNWNSNLVSELDHNNPVSSCSILTSSVDRYTNDGNTASGIPHSTTTYSYDSYGRVTDAATTGNDLGATGSPTSFTRHMDYIWNDSVSATGTNASGTFITDLVYDTYIRDSGNTVQTACEYSTYDGLGWVGSGQQSGVTQGNLTRHDINLSNGTPGNSFACTNNLRNTYGYDSYGQLQMHNDPDTNAGDTSHTGCAIGGALYTDCRAYDVTYHMLPVSATNALNQTSSISYGTGQSFAYGLWPSATTDANGQTTSYTYDALGRTTSVSAPGETSSSTTQTSYTFWCPAPSSSGGTVSPQTPCAEVDQTQRLDSAHTVTSRSFYDGFGRLVETRTPGPNGQDVVQYASYDNQGHLHFTRQPYFVASYTGPAGAAAYATPDGNNTTGEIYTYPSHLQTTAEDALSNVSTTTASVVCGPVSGDSNCYAQTASVDANGHQATSLSDALGRTVYTQTYTGNGTGSPAYTLYTTVSQTYDLLGNVVKITQPNGTSADTFTYDPASRMTASSDQDLGSFSYTYDHNSNITQQSDARGAAGTVYAGYDPLNRPLWQGTQSNGETPLATWSYDGGAGGSLGIGRLSGETFASGPSQSVTGSYSYVYDARGRTTSTSQSMGSVGACPSGWTCADIGAPSLAGAQSFVGNGAWSVSAAGSDIWNASDQFRYLSQSQAGDGSVSAHVSSQLNTHVWAKAGVMLRASTSAGAPFYGVFVTPGQGVSVQERTSQGGSATIVASISFGGANSRVPVYVQVTRSGTTYSAATSSDGTHWTTIAGSSVTNSALTGTVLAGLAVTSHNASVLSDVTFDNVTPAPAAPSSVSTYTDSATYDDADRPLTTTLPADANLAAETLSLGYDNSNGGVLTSLSSSLSSPTTTLFSGVGYNAAGEVTGWQSGTTSGGTAWQTSMSASYDGDLRLASSALSLTNVTANTTSAIAQIQPGYDAVGNVTSLTTTLAPVSGVSSGGTEIQAFCYDDLNRLVWASTQATGSPCGRTGSEGIANAGYTASYSYDNLNDITSASVVDGSGNPLANTAQGSYAYNTANAAGHLHAVSSVGSGSTSYSAAYDAAGDMTCRALGSLSCTTNGSPTGQVLGYDALRRLISWQNASSLPTATAAYAYDGEGNRVWQQTTSGPGGAQTTTTTTYLLGHDEQTTTQVSGQQATAVATRYYPTPGGALAVRDATGLSYLATDHLGTPIATVNLDTGALLGEQLRAPYGQARYGVSANTPSGGMHTTVGFTGQREDPSGLYYFHARSYDPSVARFAAADDVVGADPVLNGYTYVSGMVESAVDPSGHRYEEEEPGDNGGWISGDGRGAAAVGGGGAALAGLAYAIDYWLELDQAAYTTAMASAGSGDGADLTFGEYGDTFHFYDDGGDPQYMVTNADGSQQAGDFGPTDAAKDPINGGSKLSWDDETHDPTQSGSHVPGPTEPTQPTDPTGTGPSGSGSASNGGGSGNGSGGGNPPGQPSGPDPETGFQDLANIRATQGLPPAGSVDDTTTLARLDVDGKSYYGQAGKSQTITMRVNAISRYHAETNAFQSAFNDSVNGGDGYLWVDRDMCPACGKNGAVRSLGGQLGLSSLTVFSPSWPLGLLLFG